MPIRVSELISVRTRASIKPARRSPGIFEVEESIVLAWPTSILRVLIAQAENSGSRLCGAGHCPRTAVLASRDSPASVFGVVPSGMRLEFGVA